jgi:hypothetical protein
MVQLLCQSETNLIKFTIFLNVLQTPKTCSTFSLVLHVHTVVTSKLITHTIQHKNQIILRLEYITRFHPSKALDVPEFYRNIKEKPVTTLTLV